MLASLLSTFSSPKSHPTLSLLMSLCDSWVAATDEEEGALISLLWTSVSQSVPTFVMYWIPASYQAGDKHPQSNIMSPHF